MTDDRLTVDDMAQQFTESGLDTFGDLEVILRRQGHPVAARVRVDGESTSAVLADHLGGAEQEAALENLWRRSWPAHGGGGADPPDNAA
ncbi:MAG: hypothetical protein ACLP62_07010 [Acidimicrobiales bacterium]